MPICKDGLATGNLSKAVTCSSIAEILSYPTCPVASYLSPTDATCFTGGNPHSIGNFDVYRARTAAPRRQSTLLESGQVLLAALSHPPRPLPQWAAST